MNGTRLWLGMLETSLFCIAHRALLFFESEVGAIQLALSLCRTNHLDQLCVLCREGCKIIVKFQVRRGRLKDLEILEVAEYCANCDINFQIREAESELDTVFSLGRKRIESYCIPIHCLDPFVNDTRYLSSFLALAGSIQRAGKNFSGSGQMLGSRCIIQELIPTIVP